MWKSRVRAQFAIMINFFGRNFFIRQFHVLCRQALYRKRVNCAAVKCKNAVAEAYGSASLRCEAEGITEGVEISVEWYRKEGHVRLEEDANHRIEADKRSGTLTIVDVGQCLRLIHRVII